MTKSSTTNLRSTRVRRKSGSNNIGLWIIGISVAIVLVVVVAIALSNRPTPITTTTPDIPKEWLVGTTMGNPDAPVTIEAWEDFFCPACRQWTSVIEPKLVTDYIKTGKVKLEFHQFPLSIHQPASGMGAQASLCANDQGGFWPYHDLLFPAQDQGQPGFTIDRLASYAEQIGLNSKTFMDCMSSQKFKQAVDDSENQAIQSGFNATPTIVVAGTRMTNPYDYDGELKKLIEDALAKAGSK
jgi:protein-disulfide isomerase